MVRVDSPSHDPPLLGRDIRWELIDREFCRVNHFLPFGKVEGTKVKDAPPPMPYALLTVETPKLSGEAILPVIHRVDFYNLWQVFQERGLSDQEEVLVVSVHFSKTGLKKLFSSMLPKLFIYVYPKGHLELIIALFRLMVQSLLYDPQSERRTASRPCIYKMKHFPHTYGILHPAKYFVTFLINRNDRRG